MDRIAEQGRTVMTRSSCICPSEWGCLPSATSHREYRESVQHVMLRTCDEGPCQARGLLRERCQGMLSSKAGFGPCDAEGQRRRWID